MYGSLIFHRVNAKQGPVFIKFNTHFILLQLQVVF